MLLKQYFGIKQQQFAAQIYSNLAAFAKVDIWRIFPDLGVQWAAKPVSGSWHAGG